MNTKYNFDQRLVITISVLLTTLWLPLTAFSQDLQMADDFAQFANTQADNCAYCQNISDPQDLRDCNQSPNVLAFLTDFDIRAREEIVGFDETDPTYQQSWHAVTTLQIHQYRKQQAYVGFSETDPANQQSKDDMTIQQVPNHRLQQVYVGFSETDPAANTYKSVDDIDHQTIVGCPGKNGKDEVLGTQKISSLTVKTNHHVYI